MALSKTMKRKAMISKKRLHKYNNESSSTPTTIKSLPRDLLVEIVAIVASNSFTDLHNTKLCCKDLLDAAEDNYVFQRVSLDKFPLIPWHRDDDNNVDKESSFLKRCMENQNLESLYREGLRDCFQKGRRANNNNGIEALKVAAEKGHMEAKYAYGMILLCSQDDELMKQGLEHVRFLRQSKCVVKSRNKVEKLIQFMWIDNNALLAHKHGVLCRSKSTCKGWRLKKGQWVLLDEDDDCDNVNSCELCRWDHELNVFLSLFNVH